MRKLLLALALCLAPSFAFAQCTGVFPNNTVCGNGSGASALPRATAVPLGGLTLALNNIYVGNASGNPVGVAMGGDCTIVAAGTVTCLKTNNVAFTTAATTAIGTSGSTIPLLNGANTWAGVQTFSAFPIIDPLTGSSNAQLTLTGRAAGVARTTSISADQSGNIVALPLAGQTVAINGTAPALGNQLDVLGKASIGAVGAAAPTNGLYVQGAVSANGAINSLINGTPAITFGGITASFPSLRNNTNTLEVVLADQSNYANLRALRLDANTGGGVQAVTIGGNTASFPALRNTGTQLQVVLADNSAFTDVLATGFTANGAMIRSTYGTPTITSGACGTGANGVITSGTNQSGLVTIGAAATTVCTINFSATLAAAPNACTITPHNAAAAAWGTTGAFVSSISTTTWVITGAALANTSYYYLCL